MGAVPKTRRSARPGLATMTDESSLKSRNAAAKTGLLALCHKGGINRERDLGLCGLSLERVRPVLRALPFSAKRRLRSSEGPRRGRPQRGWHAPVGCARHCLRPNPRAPQTTKCCWKAREAPRALRKPRKPPRCRWGAIGPRFAGGGQARLTAERRAQNCLRARRFGWLVTDQPTPIKLPHGLGHWR